jgi:hemerythrin-like domain-containing protein
MTPVEILKEEHELIMIMLRILEKVCANIEAGESMNAENVGMILDFFKSFADIFHHAKEEALLFPAMEEAGVQGEGGPIGVMLSEHSRGRGLVKSMKESFEKCASGDLESLPLFINNARAYITLLSGHIAKENNVLFPMAERQITMTRQQELIDGFERVERDEIGEGIHEKYHVMLHGLRHIDLK